MIPTLFAQAALDQSCFNRFLAAPAWQMLAEDPLYSQLGERFRNNSGSSQLVQLIWLIVPCLLGIMAIWFVHRMLERRKELERTSPRFLFRTLCQAHELSTSDQRCLWQHARRLKLENPAAVFVAVDAFAEASYEGVEAENRQQLLAIGERLFGKKLLTQSCEEQ